MATVWTCLVRIKSKGEDRTHLIEKTSFMIGRTEDADLPLTEASVSRSHLTVEMRGNHVFVTDMNSGNGTLINGQKIEPGIQIAVTANDIVRIGLAPQEFQIIAIPKPAEMQKAESKSQSLTSSVQDLSAQAKALAAIDAEKIINEARKEAESVKTRALMDLQAKKQLLETEIASLRQEAELAASTERLKYAKDADHYMMEAQKKIAKDYEEASEYVEQQLRSAQEKAFALVQEAEVRARRTIQEAQDESSRVRLSATDEARQIHQDALKKHSTTLQSLQEKFQTDMASKREEIIATARQDSERDRARIMAEKAQEIESLTKEVAVVRAELTPLAEKRESAINELKELDELTTKARKELERNNREVDNVRLLVARMEEITKEREAAERDLAAVQKRRDEAQRGIEKEIEDLKSKSILDFESSKKGQESDLAKKKLKALEEVQKRIVEEEKRYDETRKLRVVELSQRIASKVLPSLDQLMSEPALAGARVKQAIEDATRESLLNEATTFQAPMLDEFAPVAKTQEQKSSRNYKIAFAMATAVVVGCMVYGQDIYTHFKAKSATFADEKVEERRVASVFHPDKSPLYGDTFRGSYTENVLYMRKYLEVKSDSLNQQKWLLRFNNDLDLVRTPQPKGLGLNEDAIVAYTARETSMIERLGKLRDKINSFSPELEAAGIKEMVKAEQEDVAEIKRILKGDANFARVKSLEEEFVKELIRSN